MISEKKYILVCIQWLLIIVPAEEKMPWFIYSAKNIVVLCNCEKSEMLRYLETCIFQFFKSILIRALHMRKWFTYMVSFPSVYQWLISSVVMNVAGTLMYIKNVLATSFVSKSQKGFLIAYVFSPRPSHYHCQH